MEENNLTIINETEKAINKKREKFGIIVAAVLFFVLVILFIISKTGTTTYTMGAYEYKVPKQWKESKETNYVSYYYTPDNDFLMVNTEVINGILGEDEYEDILSSMWYSTGMNKEISRKQLNINNISGFSSEIEGTYDNTNYIGYFATFQKDGNVISLYLVDVKGDSKLNKDFEKIISSLKYE